MERQARTQENCFYPLTSNVFYLFNFLGGGVRGVVVWVGLRIVNSCERHLSADKITSAPAFTTDGQGFAIKKARY